MDLFFFIGLFSFLAGLVNWITRKRVPGESKRDLKYGSGGEALAPFITFLGVAMMTFAVIQWLVSQ